jgi:hypothetical protein
MFYRFKYIYATSSQIKKDSLRFIFFAGIHGIFIFQKSTVLLQKFIFILSYFHFLTVKISIRYILKII